MRDLRRRLSKLETDGIGSHLTLYVWREIGETDEQAIARSRDAAAGRPIVILGWDALQGDLEPPTPRATPTIRAEE